MNTCVHTYIHTCIHTYIRTLHYLTLPYITLHYLTLPYITLHYITLHTYSYILTLRYVTLRYATLHYTTLHYITYLHTYIHTYIHESDRVIKYDCLRFCLMSPWLHCLLLQTVYIAIGYGRTSSEQAPNVVSVDNDGILPPSLLERQRPLRHLPPDPGVTWPKKSYQDAAKPPDTKEDHLRTLAIRWSRNTSRHPTQHTVLQHLA